MDAGELPLNLQRISPTSLLNQSAALFQHHAGQHRVTLRVVSDKEVADILVDESRMMQVMDNLVSNALRYTPEKGQIVLSARGDNEGVEIIVKDTGEGIAPEELPYIFDRFYRGDQSRHSETGESGLGLAIVKALVEAQKGRVWAESQPGEGASIHLKFGFAR